jgi:hypothetical protein
MENLVGWNYGGIGRILIDRKKDVIYFIDGSSNYNIGKGC